MLIRCEVLTFEQVPLFKQFHTLTFKDITTTNFILLLTKGKKSSNCHTKSFQDQRGDQNAVITLINTWKLLAVDKISSYIHLHLV